MNISALLFRRVGDSLMATPALRAVKKHFADAHLCVITEPQCVRVFEMNPWIDEIHVIKKSPSAFRLARVLRRNGKPDVTMDFLSDPRSAVGCLLSRGKIRVGFDYRGRSWVYTHTVALQNTQHPVYSAEHKLGLARQLGCPDDGLDLDFYLADADRQFALDTWDERQFPSQTPIAAFFVHSRRDYKRWPLSCFAQVIHQIQAEGKCQPLILVTPGDESASTELRARSGLSARNVVAVQDLGHLSAVIEKCSVLVGNDGGPIHLATAVGTPTVTIFSAGSPEYWTPASSPTHVVFTSTRTATPLPGDDFGSTVSPEEVYRAIQPMLTRTTHGK